MRLGMRIGTGLGIVASGMLATTAHAQWADYVEATDTRLVIDEIYTKVTLTPEGFRV